MTRWLGFGVQADERVPEGAVLPLPTFIPVTRNALVIEPLDRSDELRAARPYMVDDDRLTFRVSWTPEAQAMIRRALWDSALILVAHGMMHPFAWWEGATGQPVTAATWPG